MGSASLQENVRLSLLPGHPVVDLVSVSVRMPPGAVSVSSTGEQVNGDSDVAWISTDGRLVYLLSDTTNLTVGGRKAGCSSATV